MRIYPNKKDFVDSTAVSRINGYVGGNGDADQLDRELSMLGLTEYSRQMLVKLLKDKKRGGIFN